MQMEQRLCIIVQGNSPLTFCHNLCKIGNVQWPLTEKTKKRKNKGPLFGEAHSARKFVIQF